jgi:hypothetical protein
MKKRRKGFGSSMLSHSASAKRAGMQLVRSAGDVIKMARGGKCLAAQNAFSVMHENLGEMQAHISSGGDATVPRQLVQDATFEYTMSCQSLEAQLPARRALGGGRRRRRRR